MLKIKKISKKYFLDVVELLQNLSPFYPSEDTHEFIWDEYISQPSLRAFVALSEGSVVGYGSYILEKSIRGGKRAHIEEIVTHPNFQDKSIGKKIVTRLCNEAKKEGCYKAVLHCNQHNVGFYEKCHFSIAGRSMSKNLK